MISSFLGFNFSGFARKHFGDSIHLWGQPLVCAILKEILQGNQVCSSNGLISLSHYAQRICTVIWTYKLATYIQHPVGIYHDGSLLEIGDCLWASSYNFQTNYKLSRYMWLICFSPIVVWSPWMVVFVLNACKYS
jgi:hypothetical protein